MEPLTEKEIEAKKLILHEIEKSVNTLEAHFEKHCSDYKTTMIPLIYIKTSNKVFLDGLKEGIANPI